MFRGILALSIFCIVGTNINAQSEVLQRDLGIFKHMDISATMGSTGIGIDVASPIGNSVQVRTGFTIMPKFEYKMDFDLVLGESKSSADNFEKLSGLLKDLTGNEIDQKVDMIGEPNFYNFKLLFDFFPLKNKHWHLTAGFYLGPSTIGKAYNTTEEMLSLVSVSIYNQMYDKAANDMPVISMGDFAIYMPKLLDYGRMGVKIGEHISDGSMYKIEPDGNSMIKADMTVDRFKPYVGFGYGNYLINSDNKYNVSFDCGIMMWGGAPHITTHDGTDLTKDVKNIGGKVGTYVNIAKKFKVFPVINIRVARRLF